MIPAVPSRPRHHARLAVLAALLAACATDGPTALGVPWTHYGAQYGAPFVSGEVARLPQPNDDWGYLILGAPQPNGDPDGAFFHLHGAEVRWSDGAVATAADVTLGRRAAVWVTPGSVVLLSLPPRISARLVVLER